MADWKVCSSLGGKGLGSVSRVLETGFKFCLGGLSFRFSGLKAYVKVHWEEGFRFCLKGLSFRVW